jgi:hypothetical protein
MEQSTTPIAVRSINIITLALAVWLIVSPSFLQADSSQAVWNQLVIGVVVAAVALRGLFKLEVRLATWINSLAGLWLIIAPIAFGYATPTAYLNELLVGLALVITAAVQAMQQVQRSVYKSL